MLNDCLISVIVPIYNVEKYLNKCIDSLINQTFTNIEIILVNDGSTDDSGIIADEYAQKDKRIRIIHKSNGGVSDARNVGIENARGKYIGFVDSDDWISSRFYEKLYYFAQKENADIVQCGFSYIYEDNAPYDDLNEKYNEYNCFTREQMLNKLDGKDGENIVVVWNKIYKKELFDGIYFPKNKIHEDEFTTYKLIYKSNKIVDIDEPLYYYRQRAYSIMNTEFNHKRFDIIQALEERRAYFNEKNLFFLANKTQATICMHLKNLYSLASKSNIENKREILKEIKTFMIKYYYSFIFCQELSLRAKLSLTLCILNGKLFVKFY